MHDYLRFLCGLHALTGCDSVSLLSGKWKAKAFKLAMKKQKFVEALAELGSSWKLSDETLEIIEDLNFEPNGKKDVRILISLDTTCTVQKVEKLSLKPCLHADCF